MQSGERRDPDFYRIMQTWTLGALAEGPASPDGLLERVREESAGNLKYRTDGAVALSLRQMNLILGRLRRRRLIRPGPEGDTWMATARGAAELERLRRRAEQSDIEKDDAADVFVAMLVRMTSGDRPCALDVGTGGGFMACRLAEAGFEVMAVDRWAAEGAVGSLAEARQTARERGLSIEFRHTDVVALRRRDWFDCVAASNSVHEMPDPRGAFRAIYRLLKPGGVFAGLDLKLGVRSFLRRGFHTLMALSEREWRRELHAAGFPRVRVHDLGTRLIVTARKPE
ncbi:MAG: class I SAM-dependent methyltransferase [Armatimonadetes bacterium]|nr:class I SAM-dependent methyltransferase [Armatimonadota bacterium]